MKDFRTINNDRSTGDDPVITALLRSTYASPAEDSYWQGLEQRVMARLNETPVVAWWSVMSEWRLAGAIAATIGLMLAGATVFSDLSRERQARELAARTAIEAGMPIDDATFSFGARQRLAPDAPERYLDPFDY